MPEFLVHHGSNGPRTPAFLFGVFTGQRIHNPIGTGARGDLPHDYAHNDVVYIDSLYKDTESRTSRTGPVDKRTMG